MVSYFVILVKVTFRMKISKNLIRKMNGIFYYFSHREGREGGREEGIQKVASKWLKIGYVQVKSLYFNEFLFFLWRHKSYGFKNLVKLEGWQSNFRFTAGTCASEKSCSTSNLAGVGAIFDKFHAFFRSKSRACQLASLPSQTKPSRHKPSWAKWDLACQAWHIIAKQRKPSK